MGTNSFLNIWLRQSVPALVVYPPGNAPHMLACRGTCHDGAQFLREPCQVVKQDLSLFIHDILHESFHPALLRPVHISLREGSFGIVMKIILFRTDCLLPSHKFTLHGLESRTNHFTISIFYFRKSLHDLEKVLSRRIVMLHAAECFVHDEASTVHRCVKRIPPCHEQVMQFATRGFRETVNRLTVQLIQSQAQCFCLAPMRQRHDERL